MAPHAGFSPQAVTKDLERRWGLTLVSFVPAGAAEPVLEVQRLVRRMLDRHTSGQRPDEPIIEFYAPEQLHSTHLTLTRSSAWGPVRVVEFVKPGVDPGTLCEILSHETAGLGPITVRLERLEVVDNGFVLRGVCADGASTERRVGLLSRLNERLPAHFNLDRRAWDTDPGRYASVHMRVGFLKRACDGFEALVAEVASAAIEPITITFPVVTLLHHRYRSLRPPHAGSLHFPLDGTDASGALFSRLNLLP